MGDAVDVLGLNKPTVPKLKQPFKPKKDGPSVSGVSREVAALSTGAGVEVSNALPSLVPTPSFKAKRKRDKPVHWEWKAFSNSARPDGLILHHWQKDGVQWDDYPFARFNKHVHCLQYSDHEYSQYFQCDEWSRDETDKLFELCRRFDLRFIIIHDKFPNTKRTVEELKDRYYGIQRKLLQLQDPAMEQHAEHPLIVRSFSVEYERSRKEQLERIYNRNKVIEQNERLLLEEARKIQQAQKKREKERKRLAELARASSKRSGDKNSAALAPTEDKLLQPGGVCLRSQLMKSALEVTPKTGAKVNLVLESMNMATPVATANTELAYDGLRQSIVALLEWQKYLQKKKYEYDNLKARRAEQEKPTTRPKRGAAAADLPSKRARR